MTFDKKKLKWSAEARDLLRRIEDGYQRRRARAQIEKKARVKGLDTITREMVLDSVADLLEDVQHLSSAGRLKPETGDGASRDIGAKPAGEALIKDGEFAWTSDALRRLERVPEGFMRDQTKTRMEDAARRNDTTLITLDVAEAGISEARKAMEEMIKAQRKD